MSEEPAIITVQEAARFLRVGMSTMRAAIKRGEIPHVRLGRRILIRRDALQRWLEEREREAGQGVAG